MTELPHVPVPHSYDTEQLPLGMFDGTPARGEQAVLDPTAESAPTREPPVCGEWSFDLTDDFDSRQAALLAGTAPAPSPTPEMRLTPARSTAPVTPGVPMSRPAAPHSGSLGAPAAALSPRSAPAPAAAAAAPKPRPAAETRSPTMSSGEFQIGGRSSGETRSAATPLPALTELKSVHEARPGDAASAIALATALDQRGNIEGALSVLLRAIEAGADGVSLRCARASILAGRLRYDDAEAELRRAAKLRSDDTEVLLLQGILACRRAKWREAVEPLSHVVKIDPTAGAAHFYLGEALSKFDRLPDAFAAYERATELEPSNWRAWKGAGMVLDRMGRSADAASFYRRARDVQRG